MTEPQRVLVASNDAYVFFSVEDYIVYERKCLAMPTIEQTDEVEEDAQLLLMGNWFPEQRQRDC